MAGEVPGQDGCQGEHGPDQHRRSNPRDQRAREGDEDHLRGEADQADHGVRLDRLVVSQDERRQERIGDVQRVQRPQERRGPRGPQAREEARERIPRRAQERHADQWKGRHQLSRGSGSGWGCGVNQTRALEPHVCERGTATRHGQPRRARDADQRAEREEPQEHRKHRGEGAISERRSRPEHEQHAEERHPERSQPKLDRHGRAGGGRVRSGRSRMTNQTAAAGTSARSRSTADAGPGRDQMIGSAMCVPKGTFHASPIGTGTPSRLPSTNIGR